MKATVILFSTIAKKPISRSSRLEVFFQACNFIKKSLQHRCFPVNIAKFLWAPILKNVCERLLLYFIIIVIDLKIFKMYTAFTFQQHAGEKCIRLNLGIFFPLVILFFGKSLIQECGKLQRVDILSTCLFVYLFQWLGNFSQWTFTKKG